MQDDLQLAVATLIHMTVTDLLYQRQFPLAHFPELVDLAMVVMGLGVASSNISFVENYLPEWDYTLWAHHRRGFLDQRGWSYASALAAWIRGEQHPRWARALRLDIRQPMTKSLRYLFKTGDSFFSSSTLGQPILGQSQDSWLAMAREKSPSRQIIAVRHFQSDSRLADEQHALLAENLRSSNEFIVLNTMWAIEAMKLDSEMVLEELRMQVDHPSEEVRSKAAVTLANLRAVDSKTVDRLANMLGSGVSFVQQSAAFALSSMDSVPDYVLRPMNRGLLRSLQVCDYGLIMHFVNAFNRWFDRPEDYFETLLGEDSPELLEIAMDTLEQIRRPLTQLQ